jgi:hypothetical protein
LYRGLSASEIKRIKPHSLILFYWWATDSADFLWNQEW